MSHRGSPREETRMNPKPAGPSDQAPRDDAIIDEATLRFILVRITCKINPEHDHDHSPPGPRTPALGGSRNPEHDSSAD